MKHLKKTISAVMAAVLCAGTGLVPAFAAQVKYPQPSATDAAAWYLYGDINSDGHVTSSDAREILRTSAYLTMPPADTSMKYGAADYDRDGLITSRDARLVLRRAAKLDEAAPQQAHPYAAKTSVTAAEALAFLRQANVLKTSGGKVQYTFREVQSCTIDSKTSGLANLGSIQGELDAMIAEMVEENTFDNTTNIVTSGAYNRYLQLKGNTTSVVGSELTESSVKSTSFSYDAAANTYTVRIHFKDSTVTPTSAESPLRQVISDVPTVKQMQDSAGISGSSGDSSMSIVAEAEIKGVKYTVNALVSGAYAEYTFNAVTNKPVSAKYGMRSTLTMPSTFSAGGILKGSFVLISTQNLTNEYTFTDSPLIGG